MASVETIPKLFARDIAAYSDAELDRYLEENGRVVEVEDPENLPDEFIQRLKERTHRGSEATKSHPIDLDQVAARLQEQSRRSPSIATTASFNPEKEYRDDLRRENLYYNMLIDDGGRPSHPLSRLEDIVKDPGEYREILSFWQGKYSNEDEWKVFGNQLGRWQDFRSLQRFARGQRGYDYWRGLWEEDRKTERFISPWMEPEGYSEEQWEHEWQLDQKHDNRVRLGSAYISWERFVKRKGQKTEQQGFLEYAEALKERLARHGFTRTFQLGEDAARQDKMTTWIEYLGYEYWWYDRHAGIASSHQRRHDKAWNKLVDSKVLRHGETEEVICEFDASVQRASEKERAERAVHSAMSAVSSAETAIAKWRQSRLSPQTLRQRLLAARSKLETLREEHESLKRYSACIHEFILQTRDYRVAKEDAKHHEILLRWMLQQVPLIESELNRPDERGSNKRGGTNMLKRNRSEELDEERHPAAVNSPGPPSKRPRRTANLSHKAVSNSADPNSSTRTLEVLKTTTPKTGSEPQNVNGHASLDHYSRTCKPRRSARIAAKVEKLNAAITAATLVQAPTPTTSTLLKKRKGKRGRPEIASRRHTSRPQGVSKKARTHS